MKKFVFLMIAAAAATTAMAESAPYAKVVSVSGNVTVAAKSQMVPATAGMVLAQGSSVLPSSTGVATIQFASGCTALVKSGQAMSVQESACSALHASSKAVVGAGGSQATGGLVTGAGLTGFSTTALVVGGITTLVIVNEVTKSDNNPAPISGS